MTIASGARRLLHATPRLAAFAAALAALPALAAAPTTATFEGGAPAGFFVYNGGASSVTTSVSVVAEGTPQARPGQVGDNGVLQASFTVGDFGGFGVDFSAAGSTGPQDWSGTDGFAFWFYGAGTGLVYQAEIFDNRSDPSSDTSERFDFNFTDDTVGWRYVRIPFSSFGRATDFQPAGAPDDGLTLTEMWGWSLVLPVGSSAVATDDVGPIDHVVDAFETGLPSGSDASGVPLGFFTFQGASSTVAIATSVAPPAILPAVGAPNTVLQVDFDVTSYAGFVHNFSDAAVTTWTPQDWTHYEGFALWLYGTGSGTTLFIDLLDNRNPGSTSDDAERWTVSFLDDFTGWKQLRFPFTSFTRKEIGNGAPNDGLTLSSVHGWALGALGTAGPRRYFLDQASLFGAAGIPPLTVGFGAATFGVTEGGVADVSVRLSRPMGDDDPDQVTVAFTVEPGTATPDRDYVPASGTLTFSRGGASEQTFAVATLDDLKHEGGETAILRLSGAVGAELGAARQAVLNIADDDPFDPNLLDDFEAAPDAFREHGGLELESVEEPAGGPLAVPGQGAYEGLLHVTTPILVDATARAPHPLHRCRRPHCRGRHGTLTVAILTTPLFDALTVDPDTVRLGAAGEVHRGRHGHAVRHVEDFDRDGDLDLVLHFDADRSGLPCDSDLLPLTGRTYDGKRIVHDGYARFGRDFAGSQDWSRSEGLSFWFYGTGSGDTLKVQVKDNRAPDPGPAGWRRLWSDEFRGPAGQAPSARLWGHEIGDGSANSIPGWGNSELEYYTDDPANAALDGAGHLVITARAAGGSLSCYYGPCEYTSARLTTQGKREVGFGRVEAKIRLPRGAGLWPAFWSLGTDIGQVGWPQTGEIDVMEWVGRDPSRVFGTIHGPGYSGGASFGGTHDFARDVSEETHVFAVEREPGEIRWYVDGILYHSATPADVAPNAWVFDHPFFLLLNMAVGGNFGGDVGADTVFPQTMTVDYVRVYGAPDTAERFEAPFVDDFVGWRRVTVPFSSFTRSLRQPQGAPDDGFGRAEVWGYGFVLPEGGTRAGEMWLSSVELEAPHVTVTSAADGGAGSLREALATLPAGGTVGFSPALAGQTIALTSGPYVLTRNVTIDAADAPGLTLSGGGADRVFIVDPGAAATLRHLAVADGFGFDLAGGILNNGSLTIEDCTVRDNHVGAAANDFWKGGGGIYNGDGSRLVLRRSTVRGNTTQLVDGGGVYAFFNTTVTIDASTIEGNTAGNVGGGIRSLGHTTLTNSTLSGNTAVAWYGGAAFQTDGTMELSSTTVTANVSNPGGPAALFVGTFGASGATLRLTNTIVAGNDSAGCFAGFFGSGPVALVSGGHNVASDGTCNLSAAGDQPGTDPLLGPLADNGGPTSTHALLPGSPAIDAADAALCPATDQRGVSRPQGAGCDVGSFER